MRHSLSARLMQLQARSDMIDFVCEGCARKTSWKQAVPQSFIDGHFCLNCIITNETELQMWTEIIKPHSMHTFRGMLAMLMRMDAYSRSHYIGDTA